MRRLYKIFFLFIPSLRFNFFKAKILNLCGYNIGERNVISSSVDVKGIVKLNIGNDNFIGHHVVFIGGKSCIQIGDHCDISSYVKFITGTHEISINQIRVAGKGYSKDISVGNGVWIGANSILLPGVTIGDLSIIGAGSVVVKDIPSNVVAVGNPCRVIKYL
jgi:maltose O-acetyltransferase